MSINPLTQRGEFFRRPAPFEHCAVLALTIQFEVESILQISKFGFIDRRRRQCRGNKDHPILFGQDQVPRQHNGPSDTYRNLDSRQLHPLPCGWVVAAIESIEIRDCPVFLLIPYTGIEYESRIP